MRYRALRIVATVYRVIGWIVIVVGVLASCGSTALFATTSVTSVTGVPMVGYGPRAEMMAGGVIGAIITLVMGLIMTALSGITLLAIAEARSVVRVHEGPLVNCQGRAERADLTCSFVL